MDMTETHVYKANPHIFSKEVCVCGKPFLDPVHRPAVKLVRGVAKPTTTGKKERWS